LGIIGLAKKVDAEFGAVFSTLGIASIIMPALTGIIADRWINAEKLYGILHILSGFAIFLYTAS
jgi:NHS family xanthosine MFS transporter